MHSRFVSIDNKTVPLPFNNNSAVFSEDRVYRYELRREWGEGGKVLWVMLNPSTADEVENDPTVRRCIGFSKKWGFGGLVVCNLFAYRSTDPKVLSKVEDPFGPDNFETIIRIATTECSVTVCGWGNHGSLGDAGCKMINALRGSGIRPFCLGTTKSGQPKHPLYIANVQELVALEEK